MVVDLKNHPQILLPVLGEFKPLSVNPTKWSITLKQFVGFVDELFQCVWPFFLGRRLKG